MPRRPDTPTAVASAGTEVVAMLGIGSHRVGSSSRRVQSASLIESIDIVDICGRRDAWACTCSRHRNPLGFCVLMPTASTRIKSILVASHALAIFADAPGS
jgi:hypothetical protein